MPSLPFDQLDALIVEEFGKEISGAGLIPIFQVELIFEVSESFYALHPQNCCFEDDRSD